MHGYEGCPKSLVQSFVANCWVCALGKAIKGPSQPLTVIKTTARAHRYQVRAGPHPIAYLQEPAACFSC